MTSAVLSTPMAQPKVDNELVLGVVTFQGRRYVATLHLEDESKTPVEVTESMKKAQGIYCTYLQKIMDQAAGQNVSNDLIQKVSSVGFIFAEDEIADHKQLKTYETWKEFLLLLNNPEMAPYINTRVTYEDVTDLLENEQNLINSICAKFKPLATGAKIELEDEETRLLKHYRRFPNLCRGVRNEKEYAELKTKKQISRQLIEV